MCSFDTIPHSELIKCVSRRIVDRNVLRLIKLWLKVPVEKRDKDGRGQMSGGRKNKQGTPQGGVISPLLANIYMNRFLKYWRIKGCNEIFRVRIVSYADDFVILSRGSAAEALNLTDAVITRLGLKLNQDKTVIVNAQNGDFDFLGYPFGQTWLRKTEKTVYGSQPIKEECKTVERESENRIFRTFNRSSTYNLI